MLNHLKIRDIHHYLAQRHNKWTCWLVLHTIPLVQNAKHDSCKYQLLKSWSDSTRQSNLSLSTVRWILNHYTYLRNGKFQTLGADRMVGSHGKVVSPFQPTSSKRGGDRTTTLRRQDVDAESYLLWTVPTSMPQSQPYLVLLSMQDKTETEFFLQRLRTPSAGSNSPFLGLSRI